MLDLPMWYPRGNYTLAKAKEFLTKDFIKVLKRTYHFYVKRTPPKKIGYGFFEPVLLCMCWCDFLGALYCGDGKSIREGGIGNTKRSKLYIKDILGQINKDYKNVAVYLVKVYRHGTVHAFAPDGNFHILMYSRKHLERESDGRVRISLKHFLKDMIDGVKLFSRELGKNTAGYGSLNAFNKGRREIG